MHRHRQLDRTDSSVNPSRSSFLRSTTFRRGNDKTPGDVGKGPLGLTTVYQPFEKPIGDLVFIHGLGGGSRKTWSKHEDPNLFWLQEWLPQEPGFQDARIHTFGYDADWGKESILNIHDFAKSLVFSLKDSPMIPRDEETPIIFVCHSLGGLVAKRAYMLSRQLDEYQALHDRIRAIFFLATPHRGSNMAELLSRILQVTSTGNARPFVNELQPNSATIQSINDEFPHHCQELQLYSFYETDAMNLGVRKAVIVPKDSAVLGYANERSTYLNANHREVCKFDHKDDPNYLSIKNSLAAALEDMRTARPLERRETDYEQQQTLRHYLDVDDSFEDDYQRIESERIDGSCRWIVDDKPFISWRDAPDPAIFWLQASPGVGKSVTSSFVITHLRQLELECVFYFFTYGDKPKLGVSSFLRSIAWQVALKDPSVFAALLKMYQKEPNISSADYRTVWRKLFLEGIFRAQRLDRLYLVVDALDECKGDAELLAFLLKATELKALHVFVTSRNTFESYGLSSRLEIQTRAIPLARTLSDIRLLVENNAGSLPFVGDDEPAAFETLIDTIVDKSNGSFLWVRLVINELRQVHTASEVQKILQEVPTNMNELYYRILRNMSDIQHGKELTRAILTWVACAARPLGTDELQQAIQLDIEDKVYSIERAVSTTCGQLMYVDSNSHVKMIHLTVREFLLSPGNQSYFAVNRRQAHTRLAMVCLKFLSSQEMAAPTGRRLSTRRPSQDRSSFITYASNSLADHIKFVSSEDDDFIYALSQFFTSYNILSWIEYLAQHSSLERLMQTGKAVRQFLRRRQGHGYPALGNDYTILDSWSLDLERLVTKFGSHLLHSPWSIYSLIPPFCPSGSSLKKCFGSSNRSLAVYGLSNSSWDDCLSTILYQSGYPAALASSAPQFAIGLSNGNIRIYDAITCQELQTLSHGEPIKLLKYGETGQFLISIAFKSICVWDAAARRRLWKFELKDRCMDFSFLDEDRLLLAVLRNNSVLFWDLNKGTCGELSSWLKELQEQPKRTAQQPLKAIVLNGGTMIAVTYRGEDIVVWDVENECIVDILAQDVGSRGPHAPKRFGRAFVFDMVFSQSLDLGLLAASYNDGELVVYNVYAGTICARAHANVHYLTSSPDPGTTLACGSSSGLILLYEFETLQLLYRVTSEGFGIRSLAFSADGCRLIDIRGRSARIWDPPVLVSMQGDNSADDYNSDTISVATATDNYNLGNIENIKQISALLYLKNFNCVVCGKSDGSICMYDSISGFLIDDSLIRGADNVSILSLVGDSENSSIFASVDVHSRLVVYDVASTSGKPTVTERFMNQPNIQPRQILFNPGASHVLVSSLEQDILYQLTSNGMTETASQSWPDRRRFRWTNHPTSPDQLILMTDRTAHIFTWSALQALTPEPGFQITSSIIPELAISSVQPHLSGSLLATTFSESLTSRSRSRLFLFPTSSFTPSSLSAAPMPAYQPLADKIECILGTLGSRLVFLHQDGWVCSTDLHATLNSEAVDRHFFFPPDWLASPRALLLALLPNGDVAFAQKDEVAIVKRGLEMGEGRASVSSPGHGAQARKRPGLLETRKRSSGSGSLAEKIGGMKMR